MLCAKPVPEREVYTDNNKKKLDLLAKMKPQFLDQGEAIGHDRKTLEKILVN